MADLRFFNPYADIRFTANRLPHWQQDGAVYFITFRLVDAVPHRLRTQWESERESWLRVHPQPWSAEVEREYHERFSGAIERWLDAGYGSCILRRRDCAQIVAEALHHFDGERAAIISSVVMPNHAHTLFVQNANWPLEKLLRSWKSFTSRKINSLVGRDGSLWQRDYFDRLVRDEKHFANCVRYIRSNPAKARLQSGEYICTKARLREASSEQGYRRAMQLQSSELLQRLKPLFGENFEKFGELGAAVSVWQNGKPIVDLYGGFRDAHREKPWTADTLVLVWSATKGIGSACVLHALQEHKIDISQRVAEFWPEFAQAGKDKVTLAQLLSHQAGLCALDRRVDVLDYDAVIRAIEAQKPLWPPGTAHGYHARTFGFLLDELVRRIAGKTLSDYWQENFAGLLNLDFWIGLPKKENSRVATMYAAKTPKAFGAEPKNRQSGSDFYADLVTPGTLARKTFTSPYGLHVISKMNEPAIRAHPIVSFGGIGSASALAKFYSMLASGGKFDGQTFFSEKAIAWMTTTLADGVDRVFQIPTVFSAGFMKDSRNAARRIMDQSGTSFGHPGAGGSHAFTDPENKIAFAYVMNQMEQSLLPTEKSLRLVDAIYRRDRDVMPT